MDSNDSNEGNGRIFGKTKKDKRQDAVVNRRSFGRTIAPEKARETLWASAGRMIAARDWSEKGLSDRLKEKFRELEGIEQIAEEVARRMVELGIVDDYRFARGFLRQRLAKKAKKLVMREALMKGVSQEILDRALEDVEEEALESDSGKTLDQTSLEKLWLSKFRGVVPEEGKERLRQGRFLASRGFSFGEMQNLWKRAKNGELDPF